MQGIDPGCRWRDTFHFVSVASADDGGDGPGLHAAMAGAWFFGPQRDYDFIATGGGHGPAESRNRTDDISRDARSAEQCVPSLGEQHGRCAIIPGVR